MRAMLCFPPIAATLVTRAARASLLLLAVALANACAPATPHRAEPESSEATPAAEPTTPELAPAEAPAPDPMPGDAGTAAADRAGESVAVRAAALRTPTEDRNAPERFTVTLETTAGDITLDVRRSWAPHAADRFYTLVTREYYDGLPFFRVRPGVLAQIGMHTDPAIDRAWRERTIPRDAVAQTNNRGMVSFVPNGKLGPATQFIINLDDNPGFDQQGFAPIGRIRELELAQHLFAGYGELPPRGSGPAVARIQREGSAYLLAQFGKLDSVKRARVTDEKPLPGANTP
jgi:cyclophilin family peptidyl-prolyl cis-trans isomerase